MRVQCPCKPGHKERQMQQRPDSMRVKTYLQNLYIVHGDESMFGCPPFWFSCFKLSVPHKELESCDQDEALMYIKC